MKNLFTFLTSLWSRLSGSQRGEVGVISEEAAFEHPLTTLSALFGTRWKPSGNLHSIFTGVAMFVMLFTIGVGNVWADASVDDVLWAEDFSGYSADDYPNGSTSNSHTGTTVYNSGSVTYAVTAGTGSRPKVMDSGSPGTGNNLILYQKNGKYSISGIPTGGATEVTLSYAVSGSGTLVITLSSNAIRSGSTISILSGSTFDIEFKNSKSDKNLRLDDISVIVKTAGSSCGGTKLGTPAVTATPSSGQIVLTWPDVENANSYQLKWNGGDWVSATSPVTKTGLTNGTSYSYQVKAIGNGTTYCDGDASASASAIPGTYYTVTWKASGSPDVTTSVRSGTKPVFPSTPSSCDGTSTSFYGWSTSTWNGKTDDISDKTIYTSADDMPNVSGAVTYYAVFAKAGAANTYVKGTSSDLTDGQTVLIVNTANNVAIKGASSAKEALSVSIVSNKITTDNTYVLWTVEPHGSGYYLKYSGNYLNGYYGSLYIDSYKDEWVLSGSGPYVLNSTLDSGSKLKCNGSSAFTVGTGTGTEYNMDFFIPETASQFLTTCCTELGSINGSVSWSNAATAVVSWDDLAHVSSWTVKYKTHAAGEWSTAGASSASAGTRSVTISSLTPCTNYDFKIIATPADGYCDKSQTIEDSQTHNWTVTSTGVTNVTPATSIPSTTCTGFSIASMTPADGYSLPTSITVTNADKTWDSSTGALTISNVTGNVTITITGQVVANFTNGETVFIQADSKDYSAWKEDACVKAYFTNSGSDGALVSTNWLFDATGTDNGKKLFAIVVPASGTLNQVQLQRFQSDCLAEHWWNNNGIVTKASSNGVNTFRSYGSADNNVSWNGSSTTLYLHGDPSGDDWASSLATFADQGGGVWTATYSNYTPDVTSADFKIKTNYNVGWIGNTGSNNNATLSDMIVGSTYNVTATLDVTDHSLVMSKTFVKGEVSFDLQGHGEAISKLTNVTAGSKISAPSPAPTATGYTFGGWYKEPACTNAWNFASDVVNETMTLYAKWTINSHTLTWNWGGGSTSSTTYTLYPATSGSVNYNAAITKPANGTMSKTGYTFSSWSSDATTMPDADLTITAQWTAKTTSITLNKNNSDASGSTAGSASWTYDQTTKNSITAATRTGYNVEGYYTAASSGTKILNADGSLAGNSITVDAVVYTSGGKWAYDGTSLTLYAHWTLKTTTVSFNQNSGTGGQTSNVTATYGRAMPSTPVACPTRAGYTFTGYYENSGGTGTKYYNADGSSATNWDKENSTWTLYAGWTAKTDTYKTALHTGASGWTSYASGVTKSGAGYTIPAPSSVTKGVGSTCEDLHYHFAGWVADDYKGSPSGHIITATGTTDATGTTYWAVWEKEGAGGGGTSSITITRSATGITTNSYGSGVERTWTQSEIDFGGHYIATNVSNTPSGASANQYIVLQKSNGTLYNTEELPGAITEVEVIQYSALACNVYCGDERLMASDNTSGGQTPSGTLITKPDDATTMTWTISASNNYKFFALKAYTSSSSGTNYITSVKVTYSTVTYEDPKAVCEACVATPSISGVSLTGSAFSTTSVPVQATGASAGDNCSLASYGFYWGTSASPTTNNTASDNLSTGTFSATLTGTFTIGTTYYYRAYATNEAPNTGYSSDGTFTLQNVTFNMHSHGGDAPATQVVPQGGKATDPGNPSETGYTFDGWYDNSSYTGSAWNFSTNTVGSGGVTLHAKWIEKPKYTITLNAGGGTISDANWTNTSGTTYTRTQSNGDESITLPTPSCGCAGWTFRGWSSTEKDNAGSFTPDKEDGASFTPASNVTYYAVYRQSAPSGDNYDKITATGDLTTGKYMFVCTSNYAMKNVISGTHMDESSWGTYTGIGSTNECDNGDYIWTIIKFGSQVVIRNGSSYIGVNSSGDITFDANPHFFTYTYNTTEERWEFTSVTYTTQQLIYNLNFKIGTTQSTDICLFKQRETLSGNYYTTPPCTAYTVTGVPNPAAGGTVTLSAATGKSGDKVYAYYTVDEDYNFTSWSASGTGASVTPTDARITELTVGSENATVTANFTAKVWRTVTWKANGVTLTGGDLGSASVKVEDGHNITTLPPTPTSCESGDGASDQFVGWVVNSENWGNKINDVSAKHIYKRASQFPTVTGDVTYHAVWAASDNTQNHWEKVTDIADVEAGFKYAVISFDDAYYLKNTDQTSDKPTVYAVTKTSGNINYTSDMEFTASEGSYGGFVFTSVAASGVKIWGSNNNDGVRVNSTGGTGTTSDEWYMVQDANYGVIMTAQDSKYLATYSTQDWRNYTSPNAGNRAANLHKYAYGYKQYMTLCCDKAITIASPTKTGSGTVAFTEDSPVPTCLGATTDIHVKITPSNGHKCTALTFTREDGEDIVIDIDPAAVIPFTAATDFVITVEQNANTTLNTSVTFTALHDYYIDNMHYNPTIDKSGGYGTAPSLSNETKGEECTGLHYKFIGWIPESDMNMTTGVPTSTANMVAGGATGKYATGTNYYAIWAEEE